MTLILACLTPRAVYQVSDRRLTRPWNANAIVDDESNKNVFLGRFSFGYTGLAFLGQERTDLWLARVISEGPVLDMAVVAERIRVKATAAFLPLPRISRRHAFQGVGWLRLKGEQHLSPGLITVHNGIDEQTGSWLREALPEFRTSVQFPSSFPGGCILNSVGVTPTPQEKDAIVRLVRKCVKHRRSTPAAVVKSLIISVRWLNGRHPRIGNSILALSIPKQSVDTWEQTGSSLLLAAPPNDSTATFTYASPQGSLRWYGPHVVSEGVVLTDVQVGVL
jgi:hypothetical protein